MSNVIKIACPVCGFRFDPKYLDRITWYHPDPAIIMKPKGYGRGWMTVYRFRTWNGLKEWIGDDPRLLFAVKMLELLRKWIAEGVLSKEFVLDMLGFRLSYPVVKADKFGLFIERKLEVYEYVGEEKEFEFRNLSR